MIEYINMNHSHERKNMKFNCLSTLLNRDTIIAGIASLTGFAASVMLPVTPLMSIPIGFGVAAAVEKGIDFVLNGIEKGCHGITTQFKNYQNAKSYTKEAQQYPTENGNKKFKTKTCS